jgi:hypothetical protein
MFKVGDIIKSRYEKLDSNYRHGTGIYKVSEIINDNQMYITLLLDSGSKFDIHSNSSADWVLDLIYYRRTKITKILGKIKNK